jgi:hypothetical protein
MLQGFRSPDRQDPGPSAKANFARPPASISKRIRNFGLGKPGRHLHIRHSAPATPAPKPPITSGQGQYPAFIYDFTKIHGYGPAERDIQLHFRLMEPAVQHMRKLKQRGYMSWEPRVPRSIKLLLKREELPDLE